MKPMPRHVVGFAGLLLLLAWLVLLLVDVVDVFGVRGRLERLSPQEPALWPRIFAEGGPIEWMQWLALGSAAIVAAGVGARLLDAPEPGLRRASRFWLIMSPAFVLLLIEDAGNPRHRIRHYANLLFGDETLNRAVELGCFVLLAVLPLYALLRYGPSVWGHRWTCGYLAGGFVLYAIAAMASATRYWWDAYDRAGALLHAMLGGTLAPYEELGLSTEFWLMDRPVEESIELMAASLMLAAAVAFCYEHTGADRTGTKPSRARPVTPA